MNHLDQIVQVIPKQSKHAGDVGEFYVLLKSGEMHEHVLVKPDDPMSNFHPIEYEWKRVSHPFPTMKPPTHRCVFENHTLSIVEVKDET